VAIIAIAVANWRGNVGDPAITARNWVVSCFVAHFLISVVLARLSYRFAMGGLRWASLAVVVAMVFLTWFITAVAEMATTGYWV
jgi:hypothetical protein